MRNELAAVLRQHIQRGGATPWQKPTDHLARCAWRADCNDCMTSCWVGNSLTKGKIVRNEKALAPLSDGASSSTPRRVLPRVANIKNRPVSSDNGGLPFERQFGHDAVAGLRGKKSFIFEGGHRVPFIAHWPGRVAAGSVPAPKGVAKGKNYKSSGRIMAHAVYIGNWKLVINNADQPAALYDLAADLAEETNLIAVAGQAERVKQMEKLYREIRASKRSTPPSP